MTEYAFELALCAFLERETDDLLARQLGVSRHGRRVVDVVAVRPGPAVEARRALTDQRIPVAAIESDVGPGRARHWRSAFACHPERANRAMERAVEIGFFERERRDGREYVRQTVRYPDWFGRIRGVENKPDLGTPGALETQLRKDVSLAALDEVVVATESYVTRAHLNRLPAEVGVWRFDPETPAMTVVREPTRLPVTEPGIELVARHPGRAEIRPVTASAKARLRRRVAERAYGKGWRTWTFPGCERCQADTYAGTAGLPHCTWHGRLVHPAEECGERCPEFTPAAPPPVDLRAERDRRTAWEADPDGCARQQAGLDRFD